MAVVHQNISGQTIADKINAVDWKHVSAELDEFGCAKIQKLLSPQECNSTAELYSNENIFRSRIVMSRHGFGSGEYKYFCYPLPHLVEELRTAIYPHLVPVANRWNTA